MATLKQGELFKPELVKQMFSKVQGRSTLAKLSNQMPIPFTGVEQFIFNLDGNAEIVGEGGLKSANGATISVGRCTPARCFLCGGRKRLQQSGRRYGCCRWRYW